jgi:subtilisin family serine protease
MATDPVPHGHARARRLLERRRDILVHPKNALADDSAAAPVPHHYYRPGELLVRNDAGQSDAFERVATQLGLSHRRREDHGRPKLRGKKYELPSPLPAAARYHVYTEEPLEDVLCRLEDHAHGEFEVTPNHVLFGLGLWGMDPFGDPRPPKKGNKYEQTHLTGDGAGVTVAIVDTGLPHLYEMNELLKDNVDTWPSEEEPWDYDGQTPVLVSPQGHGSFVAGMVRQAARNATLQSYRALDSDGVTDEWYLGHQLSLVLASGAGVINLSLGTTTRADQTLMGLSALEAAADGRGIGQAPIVVAAAGNLGDSRKCYPAADDWTISVGAVEMTGPGRKTPKPASFTSSGDWVDVCAEGVNVTSSFEDKPYRGSSAPHRVQQFTGKAVWSGTSFSAAHVSGKVAEILQAAPGLDRKGVLAKLKDLGGPGNVTGLGWYVP